MKRFFLSILILITFSGCEFSDSLLGDQANIDSDHAPAISNEEDLVAPTVTSLTDGSNIPSRLQTISGVCTSGATVSISGDITSSPVTVVCAGSSYSTSVTFTTGDGNKNFGVFQAKAGQTSPFIDVLVSYTDTCFKTVYDFTGAQQTFTVAPSAFRIQVKAWGAAGGGPGAGQKGGTGGFVQADLSVIGSTSINTGDSLIVLVGEGGNHGSGITTGGDFLGGNSSPRNGNIWASSGGGLTGVFIAGPPIILTDTARALMIAGSGGGSRTSSTVSAGHGGSTANSTTAGSFAGENSSGLGRGGGGAGYSGGNEPTSNNGAGNGGDSFIITGATSSSNLFSTGNTTTPPNNVDTDWSAGIATGASAKGGNGRVVVECFDTL